MDESLKHKIIGFVVITAIIFTVLPYLISNSKPAWLVQEEKKAFHIPKRPKPIAVAEISPETQPKKALLDNKEPSKVAKAKIDAKEQASVDSFVSQSMNTFADMQSITKPHITIAKLSNEIPASVVSKEKKVKGPVTNKKESKLSAVKQKQKSTTVVDKSIKASVYSLQVATFSKKDFAERMIKKLKKQGFDVYSMPTTNKKGKSYTVVMVGHEKSKNKIKELQVHLKQAIKLNSLIVKHKV